MSTAIERQQSKWVVLGFAAFAGGYWWEDFDLARNQSNALGQILYQTFLF